jgi:hypothetical protein
MIGYTFTLTNRNGLQIKLNDFSTDPLNFVALQEYPVFDVDVKNSEINKDGQHGIWDFNSFYGKRVLQFAGIIIGTNEAQVETLKTLMLQVVSLPSRPNATQDGLVKVEWTDAGGNSWYTWAKLDRAIRFDRQMKHIFRLDFVMTLKAPDPTIRSQTEQNANGTRSWLQGQLAVPFLTPFTIGYSYQQQVTVTNGGSFEADTIVRLYGETGGITNPYIYNLTTGAIFQVNTTLADATKWVEIDSEKGTVVDQDGNDLSGLVDSSSNYVKLQVGANQLIYWSDESENVNDPLNTDTTPTAVFTIKFRNTTI